MSSPKGLHTFLKSLFQAWSKWQRYYIWLLQTDFLEGKSVYWNSSIEYHWALVPGRSNWYQSALIHYTSSGLVDKQLMNHRQFTHTFNASPGTHFTNDFSITIQIRWKFHLALIQLLMIISRQNLAHATTAQLLCHVPNIVAITFLVFGWEQNEISITFELWWKNC